MDFLIDTHAIIWFITDSAKLPRKTKQIIEDKGNNCYVSLATYWEIGIKHSLGRLVLNTDLESIFKIIEDSGKELLPITTKHPNSGFRAPAVIPAQIFFRYTTPRIYLDPELGFA